MLRHSASPTCAGLKEGYRPGLRERAKSGARRISSQDVANSFSFHAKLQPPVNPTQSNTHLTSAGPLAAVIAMVFGDSDMPVTI